MCILTDKGCNAPFKPVQCRDLVPSHPCQCKQDKKYYADKWCRFQTKKEEMQDYDKGEMEKWKNGESPGYMTGTIINDLCNRGIIDEGNYCIEVSW